MRSVPVVSIKVVVIGFIKENINDVLLETVILYLVLIA